MSIVTISTIATSGVTLSSALRGSTLTVTGTGGIITGTAPALSTNGATGSLNVNVVNYGTIAAADGFAVAFTGNAQLYNYGYVGGTSGISFGGTYSNGLLENAASGTIIGDGTTTGAGIGVTFGGNNTLLNLGSIYGARAGIYAAARTTATGGLLNEGFITGGTTGIVLRHDYLNNRGTVTGGMVGIYAGTANVRNSGLIYGGIVGISVSTYEITNAGSIAGGQTGIAATATAIHNSSTIYGSVTGVSAVGGYISNTGSIGGGKVGVYASLASIYNQAGGAITGGLTGVSMTGSGTITNSGSIGIAGTDIAIANDGTISGSTYAILGSTLDISVKAGAIFQGAVTDKTGHGTLTLAGTSVGSLDISSFSGFGLIDFAAAGWTLAGGTAQLATGETIEGFHPGDEIILDGFSATSETYAPGNGALVLSNGSASETLAIGSLLPLQELTFSASAATTTISLGDSLVNRGTLTSQVVGLTFTAGYTLLNTGQITATGLPSTYDGIHATIYRRSDGRGIFAVSYASIINTGLVSGIEAGIYLYAGGNVINTGTIAASGNYMRVVSQDDDISPYPTVSVTHGIGYAILDTSGDFTLTADPGAVFDGHVKDAPGDGVLILGSGGSAASLDISAFSGFETIDFAPGSSWTLEGNAGQLADGQTIAGFGAGDTLIIDNIENQASFFLAGFSATSESFVPGTGLILSNATASETIDITGTFTTSHFTITSTPEGTEITAPCFCAGTRIATPRGLVPAEQLRVGDLVNTAMNGARRIRWIGRRAYDGAVLSGNHLALPIKIRRHALGLNIPSRDLFVSPDHAICEGGVLVHAWRLINGVSITQENHVERVEYFHFEFDSHDIVFAENTPVETFLDAECRTRFELADGTPGTATTPCRSRVEDGYYLERLRTRINARAGLPQQAKTQGPIRGNLDEHSTRLRGWAQDETAPEQPVELELLSNGQIIARFLANRYRPDLRRAGLGSGCHAFDIPRPPGQVALRRAGEDETLF
jgi:hypothetical protein